jgi:hypothetical protein
MNIFGLSIAPGCLRLLQKPAAFAIENQTLTDTYERTQISDWPSVRLLLVTLILTSMPIIASVTQTATTKLSKR